MDSVLQPFQHLKIPLEEITSATNQFDDQNNRIGIGGFGKVYKGQVSHSTGRSMAAIKRLDSKGGQGTPEFLKEITMLSKYKHENLVTLLGFCCQGEEMILVYELASQGSLNRHLNSPHLSWMQRLKICLDTAKGLSYLHDPREKHQRLIHCDMKSGNILLDDQWNAKVSDFGLSIMGSANEQHSVIVTVAAGTRGYCDPRFALTHTLTKESDVYSFGVVLFEVLCGRLCCTYKTNGDVENKFVPTWIESYEHNNLNDVIFKSPSIPPLNQKALKIFSDIAYQCLKESREERPTMAEVIEELEASLQRQKISELQETMIMISRNYHSNGELMKEVLVNRRKETLLEPFQHLKIQLEDIIAATNNFDDQNNRIGVGGFGKVYEGEMSHSKGRSMVAIKRLDPTHGQGMSEFLKEIAMLSNYKHENLISLVGFCCEGSEMILVYMLASHGSLDHHLRSRNLTWTQRLKICIDAAKGLRYLHDPVETRQRLIHCDIRSNNILLDDKWNAKVSNFGLSIMGSANEQHSVIVTLAGSTPGYRDPQNLMTQTLAEESDVYSFGVVLFEVLTGRSCCTYRNGVADKRFVPRWIKSYEQDTLYDIIFENSTLEPLDESASETFSDIAYRCLNVYREERPTMAEVVSELETALECQEFSERMLLFDYDEMARTAEPPLKYSSNGELMKLMSKGFLLDGGTTWFSLNKKGEHCEMRSFVDCMLEADGSGSSFAYSMPEGSCEHEGEYFDREYHCEHNNSRFVDGSYPFHEKYVKTHVETPQFLSPGVAYTVNLVFKFILPKNKQARKGEAFINLPYRLVYWLSDQQYIKGSVLHHACERKDGWWMSELCEFTSDNRVDFLDFEFKTDHRHHAGIIEAEGIEFLPLEKVEHYKDEEQPASIIDSDANWEENLPLDYEDMIKWSKNSMQWTTKKTAYSILRNGYLIDNGTKWFYLGKNGKKGHMLPAHCVLNMNQFTLYPDPNQSRFGKVAISKDIITVLKLNTKIQSWLVSPTTTYATYLVYKLAPPQWEDALEVRLLNEKGWVFNDITPWYIHLASPQTPVVAPKAADQNTHNVPSNRMKKKNACKRKEGWYDEKTQFWSKHHPQPTC